MTKQSTTWNTCIACLLVALSLGSAATAQDTDPPKRDIVKLHRHLSVLIVEITTLEEILRNVPTTERQRQRLNKALDRMRRKVSRLMTMTPARIRRRGAPVQRPIATPAVQPEVASPPAKPKVKPPKAMAKKAFETLRTAVKSESFASNQLRVIRAAADHHHFSVKQVLRLIELVSFSDKKLKAIRALYPRIIDPKNAFQLHGAFTFESDKRKLRAILEN